MYLFIIVLLGVGMMASGAPTSRDDDNVAGNETSGANSSLSTTNGGTKDGDEVVDPLEDLGTGSSSKGNSCPDGWIVYDTSCYLVSRETKSFNQARLYCQARDGDLIVLQKATEWETLGLLTQRSQLTWLGLTGSGYHMSPQWISESNFDPEHLPWSVKLMGHGATALVNCAAYYNALVASGAYVNYYDCNINQNFVCEKNTTTID